VADEVGRSSSPVSTTTPSRCETSARMSEMLRLIVVGVMPCVSLYSTWRWRRRSVSRSARSIEPVIRSA
jgi:hypothetical protein